MRTAPPEGSSTPPFGVAIVGAGGVAESHAQAASALPETELVAVCDVDEGAARRMAISHAAGRARWTTSLEELLAAPDVDGLVVCVPNWLHAQIGRQVIAAGKHLLMEKPLALDASEAAELATLARASEVTVTPGHTHRFYDYGRAVKSAIGAGGLGRLGYVRISSNAGWLWGGWQSWVLDPARSGGHALHNGVHLLDLATWWIGERPVEVRARGQRRTAPGLEIYDYVVISVRYDGGCVAVLEFSRGHRPATLSQTADVVVEGSEAALRVPWDGFGATAQDDAGIADAAFDAQAGFERQLAAWVAAATGAGPEATTVEDGALSVALAAAAEQALASDRPVTFRS